MVSKSKKRWTRRKFLAGSLGSILMAYGYARWIEPEWLAVRERAVRLGRMTGGPLRLLHLSDFHASEDVRLEWIEEAIAAGVRLRPDLVCLTGDFITWRYDAFGKYAELLKLLADLAPTYAVLGNHDGGRWVGAAGYSNTDLVEDMLTKAGIELLHNRSTEVTVKGERLLLAGVGDLWAGEMDGELAFAGRSTDRPVIVLAHNPDSKELLERFRWDLMLSGHTHGGQCDLMFFGTPFAPVRDHRFVRGLRPWNGRWIHVTPGIGNLHGMRFNCRPEASLLTIT